MDVHEKAVALIVAAVVKQSDILVNRSGQVYVTSEDSNGSVLLYSLIKQVSRALQDEYE